MHVPGVLWIFTLSSWEVKKNIIPDERSGHFCVINLLSANWCREESAVTSALPVLLAASLHLLLSLTVCISNHYFFFFPSITLSESIPMETLSCHNDYNSQVTCTWMEHSEAHALLGVTLYQRDNILM